MDATTVALADADATEHTETVRAGSITTNLLDHNPGRCVLESD